MISVDQEKCIGCTLCVALAPHIMEMDTKGKAFARQPVVDWSPADGDFIHHCPTYAINATGVDDKPGDADDNQQEALDAKTEQEEYSRAVRS